MLIPTHITATNFLLISCHYLGIPLSFQTIVLSYLAGVFVDMDHIIFFPRKSIESFRNAIRTLDQPKLRGKEMLHTPLQEPAAALALFTVFGLQIPTISLIIHIILDTLMKYENKVFWPLSKKGFKGLLPSGTITEGILGTIAAAITSLFLLRILPK